MADQGISTVLGNSFIIRNGKLEVAAGAANTVGTVAGTVAAGDDPRITGAASTAAVSAMLAAFRAEIVAAGVPLTGSTPPPAPGAIVSRMSRRDGSALLRRDGSTLLHR